MNKFKVGDNVVCVDGSGGSGGLKTGAKYEIIEIDHIYSNCVKVKGIDLWFVDSRFDLLGNINQVSFKFNPNDILVLKKDLDLNILEQYEKYCDLPEGYFKFGKNYKVSTVGNINDNDRYLIEPLVDSGVEIIRGWVKRNIVEEIFELEKPAVKDTVNSPSHYTQGIECIDYIESHKMNFAQGNAVKYLTRYKHKNGLEDLKKARWYVDRLIEKYKEEQ